MKAVVYTQYGPPEVLEIKEIPKPVPKDNEVLIRVYAASVNYGDLAARNFRDISLRKFNMPFLFWCITKLFFGLRKPKIAVLGSEFAGKIEAVGRAVHSFRPGDAVFGYLGQQMGAYAEYICMPGDGTLAMKPADLTYPEAAVLPYGAIMALALLRRVGIQPGQKVLINGASGGIGSAAVQIAKSYGALVTGVCGGPRLEFVKTLGADKVIDYTKQDFTQNGETYDLIFDVLGKCSFPRVKRSLAPEGRLLLASFKTRQLVQMIGTAVTGGKRVICAIAPGSRSDLLTVREFIEAGKIKAVLDRSFRLEQAAAAHRYVENGHKKGQIAITMEEQQ